MPNAERDTSEYRKGGFAGRSDAAECGQGSVNGGFDVQAGGREDRYRAVRLRDQQFDLSAAENNTFGAGLNQAHDGVAVGLPGLLADHP